MPVHDVVVVGAGLAGLSAARDLVNAGLDVVVLESRARAGGRVEQATTSDGRLIQLGGEVIADFHTYYRELVAELGLTIVPSFTDIPGESTWLLRDGVFRGEEMPWMSDPDRAIYGRLDQAFASLAATVDPDDPWSHPDATALDRISVGEWLRSEGATPPVLRAMDLRAFGLAEDSIERRSLLADLRKEAAAGAHGFYDYDVWENAKVKEGSATVALRMAEGLGYRIRYSAPVARIDIAQPVCTVRTVTGEIFTARNVVCALPAGPLRDVAVTGVSTERLASLHRQQHAPTVKYVPVYESSFWEAQGQNGTGYFETTMLGGTWVQNDGAISALVPVDKLGAYFAIPDHRRQTVLRDEMASAYGPAARETQAEYIRNWAIDPWTQGYITSWRPGELTAIGPLHGSHEPPFWVIGSDQWVCGYMEGAVRTGRQAAQALIERG
jgi:monoamine oxidase